MALAPVPTSPEPPGPFEPDDDPQLGGKMSFLEHLDELRKRLIRSIYALLGGFLIACIFIPQIFRFIMEPLSAVLPNGSSLIYTVPTEAFFLQMKMAALVGLILAMPVVMWQTWQFVAPGLYSNEKRWAIPFVGLTSICFTAGALFSHYIAFPFAWRFFASFGTDYLTFLPSVASAFSLYVRLLIGLGLVFEMPTVVFFLARIGLITAGFLARNIKYAILVIFIVAALITPSTDPVNMTIVAAPMIVLYGVSIVIAWACQRRAS
ncbi:MAG: twin-arginine translocase subunit TatC [Luteitalea sp.]|nr:twin-arginine translocase subunit TatC [Luteitalea sp.]